jgi:hypothetical protein
MRACALHVSILAAMVAVGVGHGRTARAQGAWVGDPKSLTTSLSYQYVPSSAVVLTPTIEQLNRPTTNHIVTLGAEYVPIENLAVEVSVPFDAVKYDGSAPHSPEPIGSWDDCAPGAGGVVTCHGKYHYTPADLRIGARYQLLDEPYLALTPYAAFSTPMTNYQTVGFATAGRNLRQGHFGLSAGRSLNPILPHLFITGTFEFTVSQSFDANAQTAAIGQDRYDIEAQIGYTFLDGDLVIDVAGNDRHQLDGIAFEDFGKLSAALTNFHDPILKEIYYFYGGDVSYALTRKLTLTASIREFLHGYNTRNQDLYGLNVAYRWF